MSTRETARVQGYDDATYGDSFADVYDDWYPFDAEAEAAVRFLASLAQRCGPPRASGGTSATVLELGIGTGRLAIPLAQMGHDVRGIDSSLAMLDRLRAKPGSDAIEVAAADMAEVRVPPRRGEDAPPPCSLVFCAANTFFGLTSAERQQSCMLGVASVLDRGGRFVVAGFVPPGEADAHSHEGVEIKSIEAGRVVLSISRREPGPQLIRGQYVDITEAGIRLRPFFIRYSTPEQLDAMASAAGLELEARHGDWTRAPFTRDVSEAHVSVYRHHA